jgi:uracil-DNA glycosylase
MPELCWLANSRAMKRIYVAIPSWDLRAARRQSLRHGSGVAVLASYHPSAILRATGEHAVQLRTNLIEDLTRARALGASDAQ